MIIRRYVSPPPGCSWTNKSKLRYWLWKLQNEKCFWCNRETRLPGTPVNGKSVATFEHLIPLARLKKKTKNQNWVGNLVVACDNCNNKRSNNDTEQTIQWLIERLKR